MPNPKFGQFLAALYALNQLHSLLHEWSSGYASLADNIKNQLVRKTGLRVSLWDEIKKFTGAQTPTKMELNVASKDQNGLFEKFLLEQLKIGRVVRFKKAHSPKDCIKLVNGETYLDSLDKFVYTDIEHRFNMRDSQCKPIILRDFGEEIFSAGFTADHVSFVYFENIPIVIQKREADDWKPMELICIFDQKHQKALLRFKQLFESQIKHKSFYSNWVCECSKIEQKLHLGFMDELSLDLRFHKPKNILNLFSEHVQNKIINDFSKTAERIGNEKSQKRSYLISGKPGSGKTTLVKQLIAAVPAAFTTIVLKPENLGIINKLNENKFIYPLLLVIEDLDYLIPDIDRAGTYLLANFLDGISAIPGVITLITCNNPNDINQMISEKNGKIDVEIKLEPGDEMLRARQIEHLDQILQTNLGDAEKTFLVHKTENMRPGAIKTLIERVALNENPDRLEAIRQIAD